MQYGNEKLYTKTERRKKRVLPILLIIIPYVCIISYVAGAVIAIINETMVTGIFEVAVFIPLGALIVIGIANAVYAILMVRHGTPSHELLFWDMLLKLCHIPFYVLIFIFGVVMVLVPMGFLTAFLLIPLDYSILLSSSVYGICGLVQARRENRLSERAAVVNGVLHFLFCADVVSAVYSYWKGRPGTENGLFPRSAEQFGCGIR